MKIKFLNPWKFLIMIFFIFILIPFATVLAVSPPLAGRMVASSPSAPPTFDLLEFLKTAGILYGPLLAIVFGWVNYLGKLGVKGTWQFIASMISGLICGGAVMYFTTYPEASAGWFSVALFGILVGLGASGCYEGIKKASGNNPDDPDEQPPQ